MAIILIWFGSYLDVIGTRPVDRLVRLFYKTSGIGSLSGGFSWVAAGLRLHEETVH